jgi:hypothetical protein
MTDISPENSAYLGTGGGDWDDTGQMQEPEPVVVHIASSSAKPVRNAAPEYGDCMTWVIDTFVNMGKPTMILPRRYRRSKAKIFIPIAGPLGVAAEVQGSVTSPGANANIVQITVAGLAPGTYTVQWVVELDGTLAAIDGNNFKITGPGLGGGFISANDPVAGRYVQPSFTLVVPTGNATALSIRAIAAGTVGAIYTGQISITPIAGGLTAGAVVVVNSRQEPLMQTVPIGFQVPVAPFQLEWENQKPCYAVLSPAGGGPVNVSILDQAYEET